MPSACAGGCESRGVFPLKSFETEPVEDATAADQVPERHELVRLSMPGSDTSSTTSDERPIVEDVSHSAESMLVAHEDKEVGEPPRRRRFSLSSPPTREQLLTWIPFWGVILLGGVLRFWGLGDKPLHHDESLHAYYSLQLLNNMAHWTWCINPPPQGYSCYIYTPLLHGPFQFHFIALVYKISHFLGAPDIGVNTTTFLILPAPLVPSILKLPFYSIFY